MFSRVRSRRAFRMLAAGLGLGLMACLALTAWLLSGLPPLDNLQAYAAAPSSKVYDRYGRLLFEMPPPHTGRHSPVPLTEVPETLRQAVVATEDASFYTNPGVDVWAIARAVWINLQGREVLSGGSTITQQLARTLLLRPDERYERTLRRKLREAVLAWRLARQYSKDQILELYLNEIYFGNMAYGVEAAAQAYFDKHARDLDLAEGAMLAGLPQAPAYYNPLENLNAAQARQAVVLGRMVEEGYLTPEEARRTGAEKLYFASAPFTIRAPHFVMYVRGLLEQKLGLERLEAGGLRIDTTLDLDLNETARDLVRYRLSRLATCPGQAGDCPPGGHNVRNAALVALDPASGEILAMLGSPDYFSARIDGAVNGTTALRQPGSSIKPITYAAAFEQGGLTPATMMLDVPVSFPTREGTPYVPLNYDLQFRGPVRLREALASSYNVVAVRVLNTIGVEAMTGLARRLGITTFDDPARLGLATTLGGGEVRLLELTAAYAAFANGGNAVQPVAIERVTDADGRVLLSSPVAPTSALSPRVAYLITDILSDDLARLPSFGEGSVLKLSRPAAAKTGTTTDFRDNWTVGYTPDLVVGVWAGNADNEPMRAVSGISGAAPIWHDFMEAAHRGRPVRDFPWPGGLVEVEVCALSGLLPGPDCPHLVTEFFVEGTEPGKICTLHRRVAVDRATGLPATGETPPERIAERVEVLLPPEAQDWAREQGITDPHNLGPNLNEAGATDRDSTGTVRESPRKPAAELARSDASLTNPQTVDLAISRPYPGTVYRLDPGLPREAQRIVVAAQPSGATDLAEVILRVDSQTLARFSNPPYEALWQLELGEHVFTFEGIDPGGRQIVSAAVQIEVR